LIVFKLTTMYLMQNIKLKTLIQSVGNSSESSTKVVNLEKGKWDFIVSKDNSIPEKRHEAGLVGIKDKIYLLGGRGMKPVSIFDLSTQKWINGSVPPIELHHFQPVLYNDEIYVVGALTGGWPNETPVPDIYVYSPVNDTWRKDAAIPKNRQRGATGTVLDGDKIYIVCGIKNGHIGDHKKWLDTYNLKTKQWEMLPDAPRERDHFQAVIVDDKLYAVAGRTTESGDRNFMNTIGEVDVFDLKKQTWRTLKNNLPTLRAGNAALGFQNEVIVYGGESITQKVAHSEVEALNVNTENWRTLPSLKRGRHGTGVYFFMDKFYMASGCGNRGGEPELEDLIYFDLGKN